MTTILAYVLACCALLAQGRDHTAFALGTAAAIYDAEPLFKNDENKHKTAALLVAVAFREGSLRTDAIGDSGKSFSAFQSHLPYNRKTPEGWSGEEVRADPEKAARTAIRMLKDSLHACPTHPLAIYAEGPQGCASTRAQRISRDRILVAKWLERTAAAPAE
jgi:hypothetical protein